MKTRILALATWCSLAAVAAESRLTNLSVRSAAGTGAETLIVGFSVGGTGAKRVLIRGVGPTLGEFGVSGFVANPELTLFAGETALSQNDDWGGGSTLATAFSGVGAFALPVASRDAALLESVQPGSYSAQLVAASGTGVALVECYDPELGLGNAYFTNVSARSVAGTGANVLTLGFAISGAQPKAVVIRGIGPTLANFGVPGALPRARLRLFNAAGAEIGNNAGWTTTVTPASMFGEVGAFALPVASGDAVFYLGLPAGTYTAQLSGPDNTTGAALIEVYEVSNPRVAYVTQQPVTNAAARPPADPTAGTPSPGPDASPRVTFQTRPSYPFELRVASVTGETLVDFYVKSDGTVGNAVALRATDIRFAAAALAAVQQWRFEPGRRNGVLVTTHMQVPILFTLNE